jgi:transcriptional regulator with XRE-family HTH domain
LRGQRPPDSDYPAELRTLGDHIRARRLDLGLLQKDVGSMVGASTASVTGWELHQRQPELRFLPSIIAFLGYDPTVIGADADIGRRLVSVRRARGITQEALAAFLGIDPSTLGEWEAGRRRTRPSRRVADAINQFLAGR